MMQSNDPRLLEFHGYIRPGPQMSTETGTGFPDSSSITSSSPSQSQSSSSSSTPFEKKPMDNTSGGGSTMGHGQSMTRETISNYQSPSMSNDFERAKRDMESEMDKMRTEINSSMNKSNNVGSEPRTSPPPYNAATTSSSPNPLGEGQQIEGIPNPQPAMSAPGGSRGPAASSISSQGYIPQATRKLNDTNSTMPGGNMSTSSSSSSSSGPIVTNTPHSRTLTESESSSSKQSSQSQDHKKNRSMTESDGISSVPSITTPSL